MGSSGRLPAKYAGRLRSDDGVGPLSAYAPRDGHEGHGQAAAAVAAPVTVLTVTGAYVEANAKHHYGGLHLTSHPPLAAYLLLTVPALALIWRDRRPVEVLGLAVAGVVGWAALGQIDAAALVPVMFALFQRRNYQASEVTLRIARRFRADEISAQRCALILVDYLVSEDAPNGPIGMGQRLASLKVRCQSRGCGSNGVSRAIMPGVMAWRESCRSDRDSGAGAGLAWR